MKVAPVSADLLIKIALGALVIGGAVWAARKAIAALPSPGEVLDAATTAANAVNPLNNNNVFATGANSLVSAAAGRDETLGGWVYSATHADPVAPAPDDSLYQIPYASFGG